MTDPQGPSDARWYLPTGFLPDPTAAAAPSAQSVESAVAATTGAVPAAAVGPVVPRRRRPALVAAVLVVVAGLAAGGIAVATTQRAGPVVDPRPSVSGPATPQRTPAQGGQPTPGSASPTPRPSPTPTRTAGPEPGPMPGPTDLAEAKKITTASPLYRAKPAKKQKCPDADPSRFSVKKMRAWATTTVTSCLMPYWSAAFATATGYRLPTPKVTVLDAKSVSTPCGRSTVTSNEAFFCPTNDTIYLWAANVRNNQPEIAVTYLVLSHEFGHHLQWSAGILDSTQVITSDDPDRQLEISRRVELQATCFGGRFLGAIAGSLSQFDPGLLEFVETGDPPGGPRTHGTARNNRRWIAKGYDAMTMTSCNTFTAARSQVS